MLTKYKELRQTNELLRLKIGKLEQLVRLKDAKMQRLADQVEHLSGVRAVTDPPHVPPPGER